MNNLDEIFEKAKKYYDVVCQLCDINQEKKFKSTIRRGVIESLIPKPAIKRNDDLCKKRNENYSPCDVNCSVLKEIELLEENYKKLIFNEEEMKILTKCLRKEVNTDDLARYQLELKKYGNLMNYCIKNGVREQIIWKITTDVLRRNNN